MAENWTVYSDGACDINPGGIPAYGFVIRKAGAKIVDGNGLAAEPGSKDATNNVAEYVGLLKGLEAAAGLLSAGDSLMVIADSQLAIRQMTGEYQVRAETILPLYTKAKAVVDGIAKSGKTVSFKWLPRHLNVEADKLSKEAIQDAVKADPKLPEKARERYKKVREEPEEPPKSGQGLLF